jgi:hypothetical protein
MCRFGGADATFLQLVQIIGDITDRKVPTTPTPAAAMLDRKGNIRHDGGVVTEAPGVYLLGLTFLRRRKSSLIDGVGDDARDLSAHLARYLGAA